MLITQAQTVKDAFPFIRQMLADAYKVDAFYFSFPYQELQKIDKGIRETVWTDFSNTADKRWKINEQTLIDEYQLFVVESALGFYNLIALVTLGENPDFISIGPFCVQPVNKSFFKKITTKTPALQKQLSVLKHFYESLPVADPGELSIMLTHLVSAFLPEFESAHMQFIRYSKNENFFTEKEELISPFSDETAEDFARQLYFLLRLIEQGHKRESWAHFQKLLTILNISETSSIIKLKTELSGFNTLFFGKMLDTQIPALAACQLWQNMNQRIQSETVGVSLYKLFRDMVHKYCLLSQNHAGSDYSLLTRKMKLYIAEHLSEELSLQILADALNKNASYLSALFKKETGQTVTKYIQQERVRAAIVLFNTGAGSVTQVASAVGIPDCCRFSRIFKKYTEISPSQYRKMMHI